MAAARGVRLAAYPAGGCWRPSQIGRLTTRRRTALSLTVPVVSRVAELVKSGLEKMAPWFRQEERLRVEESRRPARSVPYQDGDAFGCNGSFKKLNLD